MNSGGETDAGPTSQATGGTGGVLSTGGAMGKGGEADAGPGKATGGTGGALSTGHASTAICTLCNGTCVDIEKDNGNCGGCGLACSVLAPSAVECTAGRCLATLASGRQDIWPGLALDRANVYWTEHDMWIPAWPGTGKGRVMKMPLTGGSPTLFAKDQDFPSSISRDATSVYWTTWSTGIGGELFTSGVASVIRAYPDTEKSNPLVSLELFPQEVSVYGDIAVHATDVYWIFQGNFHNDYQDGSVLKVSLADGSITTLASGQARPLQIAVDASNVYWVNVGSSAKDPNDTKLLKMPIEGGAITTLHVSPSGHTDMALNATNLYFTNYDGTVMTMPIEGGAPVTLAAGPSGRNWIATDATSVYWANRDAGTVMKAPLQGGSTTTLASGQSSIDTLTVDATSVYWTNGSVSSDGKLMKLTPK